MCGRSSKAPSPRAEEVGVINILIAGRLVEAPERRSLKDGKALIKAKVRARLGKESTEVWSILAFDRDAQTVLAAMKAGDVVSVSGSPQIRSARLGGEPVIERSIFAEQVMGLKPTGGFDQ